MKCKHSRQQSLCNRDELLYGKVVFIAFECYSVGHVLVARTWPFPEERAEDSDRRREVLTSSIGHEVMLFHRLLVRDSISWRQCIDVVETYFAEKRSIGDAL
ncbi:hypothetical protein [Thalassoglobus polymorphus]|nr:hypothetical protein [Thalassoglobus polymorphus]